MSEMRRYCIKNQVKPDRLAEYKESHAAVWPEMLRALKESGWHNYSLFLGQDGLLVGFVESPDLDEAQARMAATEVNERWQKAMSGFFVDSDTAPDEGFIQLEEVFHLETQLERAESASNNENEKRQ